MVCKWTKKWALALFSTFFFLLTACGEQSKAVADIEAEALGREAQTLSLDWLDLASDEASTNEVRDAIADVKAILKETSISSPTSANTDVCDGDKSRFTAAFVNKGNSKGIFVCSQSKRFGKIFLAQVLIHEALHLGGITDECEVTRLEIEIMTSAMRIPYKNAYVSQCGLD